MSEHTAEKDAPVEREHRDGCMTEYTWDEDDCNCRPCPVCGGALRLGACRWAPPTCDTSPADGRDPVAEFITAERALHADGCLYPEDDCRCVTSPEATS